jgi:hypothetical protein
VRVATSRYGRLALTALRVWSPLNHSSLSASDFKAAARLRLFVFSPPLVPLLRLLRSSEAAIDLNALERFVIIFPKVPAAEFAIGWTLCNASLR